MTQDEGTLPEEILEPLEEPQEKPKPDVPEQFRDKSAEELVDIIKEKESQIGKQSTEVGDLRSRLDALERQQQQAANFYQQPVHPYGMVGQYPPQQEPAPTYSSDDYIPAGEVQKIIDQRLGQAEQNRLLMETQRQAVEAQSAFYSGREAMKSNPKWFDGIENDVESVIYGNYIASQSTSTPMSIHQLRDPKTWEKAAAWVRINRGEYDKLQRTQGKPMAHTPTETPSQAKPVEEEVDQMEWTPEKEALYRGLGIDKYGKRIATKEEIAELMREEKADRERRAK